MGDMPGHLVVLLMDVSVEHRHVLVRHQEFDRLGAVARRPVPLRREVEQRPVSQDDDRRAALLLLQVRGEPRQLLVADQGARVGDVVQRDEMHAFVVEAVVGGAEELLERLAIVEGSVVLPRHEAHGLDLELAHDGLEFRHALPALHRVVGRVREIAGEHDEVGLIVEGVHRGHGLLQSALGVWIGGPFEAPVRVRELQEVELVLIRAERDAGQGGGEHHAHAAEARQLEKVPPVDFIRHFGLLVP